MTVLLEKYSHPNDETLKRATDCLKSNPWLARQLAEDVLLAPQTQGPHQVTALSLLGKVEFDVGTPEQGFSFFQQAIDKARTLNLRDLECQIQVGLGERLTHLSANFAQAMKAFDRAQVLAEGQSNQRQLGMVFCAKAGLLGRMGRLSECESLLRLATQMLDPELDAAQIAIARNNLAHLMVQDGRHERALEELQANRAACDAGPAPRRLAHERILACVLSRFGRVREAIDILEAQLSRLEQRPDHYDWASNRTCMGEVLHVAGRSREAVSLLRETLAYTRQHKLHSIEMDVLHGLAKACEQAGDLQVALQVERDLSRLERQAIEKDASERARLKDAMKRLQEERIAKQALEQTQALLERRIKERTEALQREFRERTLAERMALHWAEHDWLTGLGNRSFLHKKLQEGYLSLRAAQKAGQTEPDAQLAVLFIDLDDFKLTNDSFGHFIGDRVLATFARRLQRCMPEGSVVSRYGGDEFVVVLPVQATESTADTEARRAAQELLKRLHRRVRTSAGDLRLSASLGIALYPRDAESLTDLLLQADRAMQQSKKAGGARCSRLDARTRLTLIRQGILRRDLRQAILHSELQAWFQPIADLRTGHIHSMELLARWHHPTLGAIPATEFVALAEEQGLASALADWSLQAALHTIGRLPALPGIVINVNLSPRVLTEGDLARRFARSVMASGVQPEQIRFELTESVQLAEDPRCLRNLEQMHRQGFSLALDDFGAGYSCFNYLSRVHFDQVKLDRSMVSACLDEQHHQAVVRSVVAIAHALDMAVVAEGVETEGQRAQMLDQGCDLIQGYLLADPMPVDDLLRWLSQQAQSRPVPSI